MEEPDVNSPVILALTHNSLISNEPDLHYNTTEQLENIQKNWSPDKTLFHSPFLSTNSSFYYVTSRSVNYPPLNFEEI